MDAPFPGGVCGGGESGETLFLIKPGELMLKGDNRPVFMRALRRNLRAMLAGIPHRLEDRHCRIYLHAGPGHAEEAARRLRRFIGISGFARPVACSRDLDAMEEAASRIARACLASGKGPAYKIHVHRADKTYPLDSYAIACEIGSRLGRRFPELKARMKDPAWVLHMEIREQVFSYAFAEEGERGLPVGVAGKGILLLSGGIDSPVAGYLMAKRGLRPTCVYFHSHPYTGPQARKKAETLAGILAGRIGRLDLHIVPFTDIQVKIRERAPSAETTLHSRACMMRIASLLAQRKKANSLVTGESLAQVASQTAESLRYTGSHSSLPVFRPLIGMAKEEIIAIARKIGTFETSILPYEDCCSVFSPRHPLIKPKFDAIRASFERLDIEEDLLRALKAAEVLGFSGETG
ncbi:MAG: tRNA 4-thiouridine(8) synthase ThiI [Spirochaetia bacterium]|jgi:thiamine biosynthesis protein ThiI|nr:tRNA 4-thiouridine(8) synthase ThiI [Spirochaetia bacterium]